DGWDTHSGSAPPPAPRPGRSGDGAPPAAGSAPWPLSAVSSSWSSPSHRTGRQAWDRNSSVESPGLPVASERELFPASPSGRLAALDRATGDQLWTRDSPGGAVDTEDVIAPTTSLVLVGDALYVSYGVRSVFSVDVDAKR
ncbi:PQQ-binding-like beta-propeller repeat protein, partial [Streptomyces sp. GC420]|uniref:outer membrane protein assembly factor BamB family protein n=1 Tax=Streptomyces sp. GC420 TaxID=2697568 RepID=UPI0014151BBC